MSENQILTSTENSICTITINRPKSLNALNSQVLDTLIDIFHTISRDTDTHVVLLTGSGEKAFVAGADIAQMANMNSHDAIDFTRKGQTLIRMIEQLPKPVIAAVNGFALGGGFELALACDFIYASDNAKFALPEVTLGIMPGFGGTQNLPRLIGPNRSRELIFTGKMLSAAEAEHWGIVNAVTDQAELLNTAYATAKTIMKNGLIAVGFAKEAIDRGMNMAKDDAFLYESSIFGALCSTDDQKEGMRAFLEKRKANFKNTK